MKVRIARALAVGLALAIASLSATYGLLFVRPLPTTDGTFRMLGLDARGEVVRDAWGIPRIYASTDHDLWFLQGYVTAQDRLVQMEELRRGARRVAGERIPEGGRVAFEAYAQGVTKLLSQLGAALALPGELVLAGRHPDPWSADDVAAIARTYLPALSARCLLVDGARTLKGRPLLAADLSLRAAAADWYEVGLAARDARAVGLSLPGVPGLVAGDNGWVAWTAPPGDGSPPVEAVGARRASAAFNGGCAADLYGTLVGGDRSGANDVDALRTALGTPRAAGGARLIVDLADVDTSRSIVSAGASGMRASPHFDDQAPLWERGLLHPLPLSRPEQGRTEGDLVLRAR